MVWRTPKAVSATVRGLAVLMLAMFTVVTADAGPRERSFQAYKQKTLEELGPFDFDRRAYFLETIEELSMQARSLPKRKVLVSASVETIGDGPILSLIDIDGDKQPDMYAYAQEAGADTQHFGFLYDLNRDGKADWLTFSQGVMLAKPFRMILTSYHMIDTNYDGRADVWVNPDTDLDEDGFVEQGVFAWLHDSDFDGGVDRGEHLGPGVNQAMECTEDLIRQHCVASDDVAVGATGHLDFANAMMKDINKLLER